jgi:hypothetical protein
MKVNDVAAPDNPLHEMPLLEGGRKFGFAVRAGCEPLEWRLSYRCVRRLDQRKTMHSISRLLFLVCLFSPNISIGQWVLIKVFNSDDVTCFLSNGNKLFAGTQYEGILLTTDGGTNWREMNTGLLNGQVTDIEASEAGLFASTDPGSVFYSSNDGESWIETGLRNKFLLDLTVAGPELFACTSFGAFYSSDKGESWVERDSGMASTFITGMLFDSSSVLAATWGKGAYVSTDRGLLWTSLDNGLTGSYVEGFFMYHNHLYANTESGLFRSTDHGAEWQRLATAWPENREGLHLAFASPEQIFASSSSNGLYLSTDYGTSWLPMNDGLPSVHLLPIAVHDSFLYGGMWGSLWRRPLSTLPQPLQSLHHDSLRPAPEVACSSHSIQHPRPANRDSRPARRRGGISRCTIRRIGIVKRSLLLSAHGGQLRADAQTPSFEMS